MAECCPVTPCPRRVRLTRLLVAAALALLAGPVSAQPPSGPLDPEVSELGHRGVPVTFRGREIYRIASSIGSISPSDRARAVEGRIAEVVANEGVEPADIAARQGERYSEILVKDRVIGLITDADAQANGDERRLVASAVALAVRRVVVETRAEFSPEHVRRSVFWAVASALVLAGFLLAVSRLIGLLRRLVTTRSDRRIEALRIQNAEIVPAERVRAYLLSALDWTWVGVCVVAGLTWVEWVLSVLPWTRPFAGRVLGWALAPLGTIARALVAFLPNLFYLAAIAAVTWLAAAALRFLAGQVAHGRIRLPDFEPEWADPTYKIGRVLLVALAIVAAFPYLPGSHSPAFQGVTLLLGLIVSLSSSSAISNAIAGIILTYTNAFRTDERVRIGETTGDVVRKATFVTQVRTIKNEIVAIPNAAVLGASVQNYSRMAQRDGLILHTTVTIGYDAPWRQVHGLLVEAARRTDGLLASPPPFVLQTALNDFFVSYEINAYTRRPNEMAGLLSALHANIQDAFQQAGVEIMSPHVFGVRDANARAIPPS